MKIILFKLGKKKTKNFKEYIKILINIIEIILIFMIIMILKELIKHKLNSNYTEDYSPIECSQYYK